MNGNDPVKLVFDGEREYPVIGQGNTAEIRDCSETVILKLFRDQMPRQAAEFEWRCADAISKVYSDTPRTFGMVDYKNRCGILYEKVTGTDMIQEALRHPFRLGRYGKIMAQLQLKMHTVDIQLAQTLKEKLTREITVASGLTEAEKAKALSALKELPEGTKLCHNDFHPGNIMMTGKGFQVIDWLTSAGGAPAADVARTLLLIRFGEPMHISTLKRLLIRSGMRVLRHSYLKQYLKNSSVKLKEIREWMLPVAAARLSEWLTQHEREKLIRFIRKEEGVGK